MGSILRIGYTTLSESFNFSWVKSATGLQVEFYLAELANLPRTVSELVSSAKIRRD